jgi:hypothetical protein
MRSWAKFSAPLPKTNKQTKTPKQQQKNKCKINFYDSRVQPDQNFGIN